MLIKSEIIVGGFDLIRWKCLKEKLSFLKRYIPLLALKKWTTMSSVDLGKYILLTTNMSLEEDNEP